MTAVCALLWLSGPARAAEDAEASEPPPAEGVQVQIADPYIDIHTGPGRGFPIHQVVERGHRITISKRRTDWFFVTTERGYSGWVHREQLQRTLTPEGEAVDVSVLDIEDFLAYRWEAGVMSGDFDGAPVVSAYGAWHFSEHLSTELTLGQSLGQNSDAYYATAHLVHHPFPQWRFSPYFQLGAGIIQIEPKTTNVSPPPEDREENLAHVGIGLRSYLASRLVFRIEYNNYAVLTNRNENEKVEEWKAGFSVFF